MMLSLSIQKRLHISEEPLDLIRAVWVVGLDAPVSAAVQIGDAVFDGQYVSHGWLLVRLSEGVNFRQGLRKSPHLPT